MSFKLELRDNNDVLVGYIDNKVQSISWEWDRIGGCGGCEFLLATSFDSELSNNLKEDYSIRAYLNGTLWYSGFIDKVSPNVTGKDETIQVSCLGYINQLKRIVVKEKTYQGELSTIVKNILDNYVVDNTDIISATLEDHYTKLLLHCDGADGATQFIDDTKKTVTAGGTAQIDTAQKKFGSASCLLDGNSDYLSLADSSDWTFGSDDFTIDMWVRFAALPGTTPPDTIMVLAEQFQDADNFWQFKLDNGTGTYQWEFSDRVTTFIEADAVSLGTNTWYHVAVVKDGIKWSVFQDGALCGTFHEATAVMDVAGKLNIGYQGNGNYYFNGWMDEIRISKGIARWTEAFTVPSAAYSSDLNFEDSNFTADYLYFNESAYDCINKLSDLAGRREWGVRADKTFFFKARNDSVTRYYHIKKDFSSFKPIKDYNPIITAIYLEGGEGYNARFDVTNRITTREEIVSNSSITTQSVGQQYARMYLKEHGVPKRSYVAVIPNYDTRLEENIPIGKAAVNLKIGVNLKYDVATQLYDDNLKYDGGTESFQIEKIKYELQDEKLNITINFGPVPPSIVDELYKLEYLINNERNV